MIAFLIARLLKKSRMSLKLLLNLLITTLLLLVMMVGLMLMLANAREDVRAEIESTANLALHLLDTEILYYSSGSAVNVYPDSPFRLNSLGHVRHLRIEFYDARGHLRDSNRINNSTTKDFVPGWFMNAMANIGSQGEVTRRPVYYMGRLLGELVVTPDPSYEISEIWNDTLGLIELVAVFFVLVNVVVYWAVGRALKPVGRILSALTELENGRLDARLPAFKLPELSLIGSKFNHMAQTLEQSVGRVHELNRKIVSLQEVERRHLARELHDEVGQCLTAIHIDANAILNAKKLPDTSTSAQAILDVARHMKEMVHDILQRLRPTVLDELGIQAALKDLVVTWQERHPNITCAIRISDELDSVVDETLAITVYRITQESLTNIARHALASHVRVEMSWEDHRLSILIEDNGQGFDPNHAPGGFGLIGMRERVEGLGGECLLESIPGHGTRVLARIPCFKEKLQ